MANLTKTEKYVALTYAKYFGKTATKGIIDDYVSIGKTSKILNQIIQDADIEQYKIHGDNLQAEVHNTFQNLFSRNADNKELQKYVKVLQKGKNLPINSIVKKATKFDKDVYKNKQAIAEYVAKNGGGVFDLSKVTKANPINVESLTSLTDLQARIDALPENDFVPTVFDGQSYNLTDGLDNLPGTNKNDIFTGSNDSNTPKLNTANSVDILDGKAGIDTLKISADGAAGTDIEIPNITNIEIIEVTSAGIVDVDTTSTTGVTDLKVVKASGAVTAEAGSETDITVSGVTGNGLITTIGGKDVTVTDTASTSANVSAITVGGATTPTGNVKITANLNSDGTAPLAGGTINVTGGKTVDVTVNANSTAKAFDSNSGIATGTITVTADDNTKNVTVTQNAKVTTVTKPAVEVVGASQTVTFKDLAAGKTVTVNGLVFTAEKDLTAAEVAAAFANLTATDTQSEGGITSNGIYTAIAGTVAGWTSGAANGATVTFTGATATTTEFAVNSTATASVPTKAYTAGTAAAGKIDSTNAVTLNTVVIDDNATKSIENITVKGATTVTLGGTSDLDKIKTISLENVTGAVTLDTAATALNLTLNKVVNTVNLDAAAANITDLTIKTTGEKSTISTLTAAAVKNATIDAGAELVINAIGTTNKLETVTVKGTAAVTLGTVATSNILKSFDASANTGGVTASINAATAGSHTDLKTFVFSGGKDVVTVANDVNKAINLGAGDDKIILDNATDTLAEITGTIDGGAGTDTIHMTAALAVLATAAGSTFDTQISNIEQLSLGTLAANSTVDLAKMDNISYVISANNAAFLLTLNNMANNGTLELAGGAAATNDTTVVMKDATGTADKFNVVTNVTTANLNMGAVTVAGVETINITANDTNTTAGINEATLELTADLAKTVNVTGNSDVDLTLTGSTKVTMIDGSTMTGALTATTAVNTTTATTIKGGSGNDNLTATSDNDVLIGGAGNDTLIVTSGNLVQLHGGAGKDTYKFWASSNQNAYATINGTKAELSGDIIEFNTALTSFNDAKIVLGSTAVFQDYVNEAAKGGATNGVSYFTWAGDTYLVQDNSTDTTFKNGSDAIVKITGTVDFTFNATSDTLEIA